MARPKIGKKEICVRLNLTVQPDIKDMADVIRIEKGVSISSMVEHMIRSEYKKIMKSKEVVENPTTIQSP